MRALLATTIAAGAVVAGGLVTAAPAAAVPATPTGTPTGIPAAACAEPTIESVTASPTLIKLGVGALRGVEYTVQVRQHHCALSSVVVDAYGPTGEGGSYDANRISTSGDVSTWSVGLRITPGSLPDADAGTWSSYAYATGEGGSTSSYGPDVRILRAARLSADAAPEPVAEGDRLTVTGRLTRADWSTLTYRGYPGRTARLQFRPTGGSYRTVATAVSDRKGRLRAAVTARTDGSYRWVFAGSSTTGSARSAADRVDVR